MPMHWQFKALSKILRLEYPRSAECPNQPAGSLSEADWTKEVLWLLMAFGHHRPKLPPPSPKEKGRKDSPRVEARAHCLSELPRPTANCVANADAGVPSVPIAAEKPQMSSQWTRSIPTPSSDRRSPWWSVTASTCPILQSVQSCLFTGVFWWWGS